MEFKILIVVIINMNIFLLYFNDIEILHVLYAFKCIFFRKKSTKSCLQNRFQINETFDFFHLQVNEILKCVYMLSTFTKLQTISIIYQTSNL
jgi:hypothetical protein